VSFVLGGIQKDYRDGFVLKRERATLDRYHHFHGHSGMCARVSTKPGYHQTLYISPDGFRLQGRVYRTSRYPLAYILNKVSHWSDWSKVSVQNFLFSNTSQGNPEFLVEKSHFPFPFPAQKVAISWKIPGIKRGFTAILAVFVSRMKNNPQFYEKNK